MSRSLQNYVAAEKAKRVATPQTMPTVGRTDEVENSAGGFVFEVSDKTRLERFLILGTDGGTYYVSQDNLTEQNAQFVIDMIQKNERLVVDTVVDVSCNGRAAKNSPALFVLALVFAQGKDKQYARAALPKVARTSTHLFEFAEYLNGLGGWGRAKRQAVADWYTSKEPNDLAYQSVKYRQRNGWTHRDLFRLSHPRGVDRTVGNFILGKGADFVETDAPIILQGFAEMQRATSVNDVLCVLEQYKNLPWETIPTQFLTDPKVWKVLFYNGALGQTALLRNVTRFARIGAFNDLVFAGDVAKRLADEEAIKKGRIHPVAYANALGIYRDGPMSNASTCFGTGRRSKNWETNSKVLGALEAGFYNAFSTVEPSNKRTMVSIDVSASMTWGAPAGLVGMDYRQAAAAMAMVLVRTEPYVVVNAFSQNMRAVDISESDSLQAVTSKINAQHAGATDCSLPMIHAKERGLDIDHFSIYTDNETWAGRMKPVQALDQYNSRIGREARVSVVGMAGTPFTIADPTTDLMLDVVGFDASAPRIIADFAAGRV